LQDRLKALRYYCIDQGNEPYANAAFRAQMMVWAVQAMLEMWVLLKEDKPCEAWEKLADAQEALRIAQRIQFDPETHQLYQHLLNIEKTAFPFQMFFSSAYSFSEAFCSICDGRLGECEHVTGRIYMGQICRRVIKECKINEYSIVFDPEDKRCRIENYAENGKRRCTLTRRELPQDAPIDPTVRCVGGTVMRFD
jgi:hypothetical protein